MTDNNEPAPKHNPNVAEAREHFQAARKEMRKSIQSLLPEGFIASRRAARKEFLLGLRKLLDAAIEHTDK